jgi:hypothetical protein
MTRSTRRSIERRIDRIEERAAGPARTREDVTISPETEGRFREAWEAVDNPRECSEDVTEVFVYGLDESLDSDVARTIRYMNMKQTGMIEDNDADTE